MLATRLALTATLAVAAGAHAQAPDEPAGAPLPVDIMTAVPAAAPFKVETLPRTYIGNAAGSNSTRIFDNGGAFGVYRTDPKLVAGIRLTRHLAVETGYSNLISRGHYFADYTRPDDVAGGLGAKGFHSYVATRLDLPLGERLQVTAKVGVAHSEYVRVGLRGGRTREFDVGPYASLGLQYQLGRSATLVGAYERYGDTERRWGVNSNSNGFSVKLNVDF
jgi:hypothetical protein